LTFQIINYWTKSSTPKI